MLIRCLSLRLRRQDSEAARRTLALSELGSHFNEIARATPAAAIVDATSQRARLTVA